MTENAGVFELGKLSECQSALRKVSSHRGSCFRFCCFASAETNQGGLLVVCKCNPLWVLDSDGTVFPAHTYGGVVQINHVV